jgi:hypothetical protein
MDNTTNQESVQISQRSGSNTEQNNVVNSELATNNKQTNIVYDKFETVGHDDSCFVGNNRTVRVVKNNIELKGFKDSAQIDAFEQWRETYRSVANTNAQFKIKRGGFSVVGGSDTELSGSRGVNPVLSNKIYTVENVFRGYTGIPKRTKDSDEVVTYVTVPDHGNTKPAAETGVDVDLIEKSAGSRGSQAPGVLEFGASVSAATENGSWSINEPATKIDELSLELQDQLSVIEKQMGDGGDDISFTKKNKFEQIGATFNNLPALRIDEKGRSQPFEMLVSDNGIYKNHDYIPHVEEVDNSSNFPCGEDVKIAGNKYVRIVGSGGISLKTTGSFEIGGTVLNAGFKKVTVNASHGIHIGSENGIELQSLKTIVLRTNRQVYVESALGVRNNLIVGGGLAVEGETYLQHITAPLEVQQTQDTTLFGQFATDQDRRLFIGEALVGGIYYPVFAKASPNLIANYPHSHHFNNAAMTLTKANEDVRKLAHNNNINDHSRVSVATQQLHERKVAVEVLN